MAHHGEALARESGEASLAEAVASGDLRGLTPRMAALCRYAIELTSNPSRVCEGDLAPLREAGLDDRGIVDANQVVAYFNYVNRIAHGLGVELESSWPEDARTPRHYVLADDSDGFPVAESQSMPWLTVDQMREVDRAMMEDLGITLERMMENAGRSLAVLARGLLGGDARGRHIRVLAGAGGNGGGGMVAARHLAVAGAKVDVCVSVSPEQLAPVPAGQYRILRAMNLPVAVGLEYPNEPDLVLDALLGYGQSGAPRGEAARLIGWTAGRRVLALDVPSGLELETGRVHDPHILAAATLTLALPKEGLRGLGCEAVGDLYLADISVPISVYQGLGIRYASPFGRGPLVRIADGARR